MARFGKACLKEGARGGTLGSPTLTKELPLEYAVEMNRLIQLQMEGSVG